MVWVLEEVERMVELFTDVALTDPLSGLLVAIGGLITFGAIAALGVLALGAFVNLLNPESN